jgi:MFS family permease
MQKAPLRSHFGKMETRATFFNAWIGMTEFALAYLLPAGFLPTLFPQFAGIDPPMSLYVLMIALASSLLAYVIIGWMSDHIGSKRAIYVFSLLGIVLSIPMFFLLLLLSSSLILKAATASILTFTVTGAWGIFLSCLSEKFPVQIRATGVGSTFNRGFLI